MKKVKKGEIEVVVTGRMIKPRELEERCVVLENQSKQQQDEISKKTEECNELMAENKKYVDRKTKCLQDQKDLNEQLATLRKQIAAQKRNQDYQQRFKD